MIHLLKKLALPIGLIVSIILFGILPMSFWSAHSVAVDPLCKTQVRLLLPKISNIIPVMLHFEQESTGQIIGNVYTPFGIKVSLVRFPDIQHCEEGTSVIVAYYARDIAD